MGDRRVTAGEVVARGDHGEILVWLALLQEEQMAAIDELRAAVASMQEAAQAEHDELTALVGEVGQLEGQVSALQQQAAAGSVSEADIASLAESVTAVAQAAQSAVEQAKSATSAAPADPPAPAAPVADPTGLVAEPGAGPSVAAPTSTPADPVGGTAPAGSVTDPSTSAPTGVVAEDRTVYVFGGDPSSVDPATWPQAPVQTQDDPPRQLYYFAGDTDPGQQAGAGVAGWEVYSGATQPTVAAAAASAAEAQHAVPVAEGDDPEVVPPSAQEVSERSWEG